MTNRDETITIGYSMNEAELLLKEIDEKFEIKNKYRGEGQGGLAGVYWNGFYAEIGMPQDRIYPIKNEGYIDEISGKCHRCMDDVIIMAKSFKERIENDKEYYIDITTPFEFENPSMGSVKEAEVVPTVDMNVIE